MAIISLTLFRKMFILYPKKDKTLICNFVALNICQNSIIAVNNVQSTSKCFAKDPNFTDKNEHLQKYTQRIRVYANVNQLGNTELLNQYQVERTVVVLAVGSIK